ncbi:transport and Golgi organization protein 1 homolog isoform X2 [Megalops cyprinoides]|uniref:transport and Golgi organization protein 1 homolog isoform X2 n=1 Tax=Megalops cyprinoides TaxID=118141 RepID=UPI001864024F|nr:transport and Golgi organization protein 1 homolog isoform X2 [Megalops cyprinoides]
MAVTVLHLYLFILLVHTTISKTAVDKRFSDFKRCADEECSMLLCRGKAAQDFNGPDCRFLSFKKGETIYVYYKLSGKKTNAWAGSVGSRFGYFPKDLLIINHIYTDKELEVPAEQTDFVCFDTGYDKFENYDIDVLLGTLVLSTESENSAQTSDEKDENKHTESSVEEAEKDHHTETDLQSVDENEPFEDFGREDNAKEVGEDRALSDLESMDSSQLPSEKRDETVDTKELESEVQAETEDENEKGDLRADQHAGASVLDSLERVEENTHAPSDIQEETLSKNDMDAEKADHVSEGQTVPDLKTNYGSTFDAVTSDDEDTWRVTPYFDEEEGEEPENQPVEQTDDSRDVPLLSFSEEDSLREQEGISEPAHSEDDDSTLELPSEEQKEEKEAKEDKSVWTSLGDTVFAIVSGGERTDEVSSVEDDDDEDDFESDRVEKTEDQQSEHVEKELQPSDPHKEPEETVNSPDELIFDDLLEPSIKESDDGLPNIDSHGSVVEVKTVQEMSSDEDISKVEEERNAASNEPEPAVLATDEKSESPDESKPDAGSVPRESSGTLTANDENLVSVKHETSVHSEQEEKSDEDIPSEKSAIQDPTPVVSRDEKTEKVSLNVEPDEETVRKVDHAKKEITHLFEDALEEESPPHHSEEEEESEDHGDGDNEEELLEDENAMLSSSKTEQFDVSEENADSGTEVEEPGAKEPQTDTELEELEEYKPTNDTHESEEASSIPLITENRETDVQSEEMEGETPSEMKDTEPPTKYKNENAVEMEEQSPEVEYSDSIKSLMLLRSHFNEKDMERMRKYLGPQHLLRVEAMFTDLEQELRAARQSQVDSSEDVEKALEGILEASETSIMDEIERMLDARELKHTELQQMDGTMFDEEAAVLDDFQELAFHLRQKYSTASDSVPLTADTEGEHTEIMEDILKNFTTTESIVEAGDYEEEHVNDLVDSPLDSTLHAPDMGLEEDGGHFNKNKENQKIFKDSEEIQKRPQAILENQLDVGFGFGVEHPSSGSLDSASVSDYHEDKPEASPSSSFFVTIGSLLLLAQECLGLYMEMIIASLPEEWQPGPTFHGLPWKAVISTAAVGIFTFLAFFWRTVLTVKSRTYLLTEKQLAQKITQLFDEKSEALAKITDLNKKITECEEKLKESQKSASSTQRENKELKESFKELRKRSEQMKAEMGALNTDMEKERRRNQEQLEMISQTEKEIEKFKRIVKSNKDELSKVQVLMDEARIREDALKAEVTSLERENGALKDKKKSLLREAKDWEEKHKDLSDKIKVYQKSQKDLEDTLVHKENEIEVLSDCISELRQLEACESTEQQKGSAPVLANGEAVDKKNDAMKIRIKQMMDVSRVKTTLSIVEEERNRYLEKLIAEEKQRHDLEEQIKKLEHDRASLHGEKCQLENQFNTIQQKLEIMNELYQQKENALQQKLTQEEFERREKETKLSEVDGKALRAEEELKAHKRRIQEIEEELQKTERSYKTQIAAHEKKAHENWLNARASERALVEEKRETANLRQKLVEVNDKLAEFQRPLFKPTPGRPDQHMPPLRRGDSYGPSPVSGGAPSPPLMIEGPGRPPSAPVGRRNEPFGRPPSDPHGRYSDLGHPLPARPDVAVPRTSSPTTLDGSRILKSQGPSFLASPIRDFPVPGPPSQPKGYGPPPMVGPPLPPPHGPPPSMPPPLNGHPPMMPPGPPVHDPRLPPPRAPMGPYGPPRPYGPVPPPYIRGMPPPVRDYPMGPPPFGPQEFHPDMRDHPHGPRDYPVPPRPLPPGAIPPPGIRDHTGPPPPPQHVGPEPRNFSEAPHHGPDRRDNIPQQTVPRETPATPLNGP